MISSLSLYLNNVVRWRVALAVAAKASEKLEENPSESERRKSEKKKTRKERKYQQPVRRISLSALRKEEEEKGKKAGRRRREGVGKCLVSNLISSWCVADGMAEKAWIIYGRRRQGGRRKTCEMRRMEEEGRRRAWQWE